MGVSEAAEESVEGEVITEPCEGYDVEAELLGRSLGPGLSSFHGRETTVR